MDAPETVCGLLRALSGLESHFPRSEFPGTELHLVYELPSSASCQRLASQPHTAAVAAKSHDNLDRTV